MFMGRLGLTRIGPRPFHPLFHEVVRVEQAADPSEPIRIVGQPAWSGWMLGSLVFRREGVRVVAGTDHALASIAECSTIYWTFVRGNRPTADLSMGWGSNSQWRTSFRRDYAIDGMALYNVDGAAVPHDPRATVGLDPAALTELVRHRCFIVSERPSDDLWPYAEKVVEPLPPLPRT